MSSQAQHRDNFYRFDWITIEPIAFLSVFSLYIEFPAIQDLIYTQACVQTVINHNFSNIIDTTSQFDLCDRFNRTLIPSDLQSEIGKVNSRFWLRYELVICLLCALSAPHWGGLSDRIGRLGVLNVPLSAAILSNAIYFVYSLAMHRWPGLSFEWLMVGAILTGLSGAQTVVIINSFGYVRDTTDEQTRSKRITLLEAIVFVSQSLGFFLNGYMMKLGITLTHPWANRHLVTFSLCVVLNCMASIYTLVRLRYQRSLIFVNNFQREQQENIERQPSSNQQPQTLPIVSIDPTRGSATASPELLENESNEESKWSNWITLRYYAQVYGTLSLKRESRSLIHSLLLSATLSALSIAVTMSLLYNYVRHEPFLWTTSDYSRWNGWSSASKGTALVALSLAMRFSTRWDVPDALIAILGFTSRAIGNAMIGFAQSSATINYSLILSMPAEFTMPPIRSLLSKLVPQHEVCKIYSCVGASQNICFAVGNIVFYFVYVSILDDMVFYRVALLGSACAQIIAIIMMIFVYRRMRQQMTATY